VPGSRFAIRTIFPCSYHFRLGILFFLSLLVCIVYNLRVVCVCSRTDHSANVFTSMKTIMTLVIDESEDISSELLSALLDTLKKDNKVRDTFIVYVYSFDNKVRDTSTNSMFLQCIQDVRPIAERLAEKVMHASASKLKPYMVELIQSGGASLSEYNEVVASICQESSGAFDHVETHVSREALVC